MFSLRALVDTIVWLIIVGVIFGLLRWLLDECKVPEPWHHVGRVLLAIVGVIVVIGLLLSLLTGQPLLRP